jgi:hypothetical protein
MTEEVDENGQASKKFTGVRAAESQRKIRQCYGIVTPASQVCNIVMENSGLQQESS